MMGLELILKSKERHPNKKNEREQQDEYHDMASIPNPNICNFIT